MVFTEGIYQRLCEMARVAFDRLKCTTVDFVILKFEGASKRPRNIQFAVSLHEWMLAVVGLVRNGAEEAHPFN
jgi:hypothetical protein